MLPRGGERAHADGPDHAARAWPSSAFGVFYLVMLAGTLPKLPRVSWLIPLVWLVLSFKGIRQGPLFAITAAVARSPTCGRTPSGTDCW